MAIDEVLLESAIQFGKPVLRFYSWSEPAGTFGYFQKYSEVAEMTRLRPLVRRPTGGGLVPHDADWTYSLVFPPEDAWYQLKAVESYERVHSWVQAAFLEMAVPTNLSATPRAAMSGQCFLGAEQHDVLWMDRKIAGGAQRRNRKGLLIQGSIQPPAGLVRERWEAAFCNFAEKNWSVRWIDFHPGKEFNERVAEAVAQKFGQDQYNRKR
jgi:lipoate-protein ligase A